MDEGKRVRHFVEPIVVCGDLSTLGQVLDTLNQGKPVAIRWPTWQLLLPENAIGYPLSRRVIDLPLQEASLISADLPVQEALEKLDGKGVRYALADDGMDLLGVISIDLLRKHSENKARDQALESIKVALQQKDLYLKETHHRIKNNLQIIASLLSLQASYIHDPHVRKMLIDSQDRVRSMALIHEALYQAGNMGEIDLAIYIENLASELLRSYEIEADRITLHLHLDAFWLDINKAIPCGLILNELISNALKHAFPIGQLGEIHIELQRDAAGQVTLVVRDTGIGIAMDQDIRNGATMGLQLVHTLTEQLEGHIEFDCDEGTKFRLTFTE